MKKSYYPHEGRTNVKFSNYLEIALEQYNNLKSCLYDCEQTEYDNTDKISELFIKSQNSYYISIIFAVMSIESFLNDYIAACIDDNNFYDNFDNLSIESKLQLIAQFIFQKKLDKSKSFYFYLKRAIAIRNKLTHCKSKYFDFDKELKKENKKDKNEIPVIESEEQLVELSLKYYKTDYLDEIKEFEKDVSDTLKGVRDLAYYFDENDSSVYAVSKLFHPFYFKSTKDNNYYINVILKELNINGDFNYET